MGAKKKSKANKLARMSEEERIRYLQHRAAVEEEARQRKEQLIATFLKNKLKREQIFSRLNDAKINQEWRQILRRIKCEELKQELEDLNKWFYDAIAKKNKSIDAVLVDLDEAENQYSKMHWSQMETMEKLIEIHRRRIDNFYEEYKAERDGMREKSVADIDAISESCKEDEEQLQVAIFRTEQLFSQKTSLLAARHSSRTDELRNNMLTDLENLKNSRESRIEEIWRELETILKRYFEPTEERRREHALMQQADGENCKQIFENDDQINDAADLVKRLKSQLFFTQTDGKRLLRDRKREREMNQKRFQDLKEEIENELHEDKKNLNFMNFIACKTTEELKQILTKGEQIIKLHGLCASLETQREKSTRGIPGSALVSFEKEKKQVEEENEKFAKPISNESCEEVEKFEKFWNHYNAVLLEKEALVLYNRALMNERKHLKSVLKNYFSEFVVKQPESKLSFAKGIAFAKKRPFTTTIPKDLKSNLVIPFEGGIPDKSRIIGKVLSGSKIREPTAVK